MNKKSIVPSYYIGREQALIKHELLKAYLEKLLMIVGISARRREEVTLSYVDCFAGPWGERSEALEGTSISISLTTLANCRSALRKMGVDAKVRALYIEQDSNAYSKLEAYLKKYTPKGITSSCFAGDFEHLRDDILHWCGDDSFTFFFIDPKGWMKVGVEVLKPLLQRPRSVNRPGN